MRNVRLSELEWLTYPGSYARRGAKLALFESRSEGHLHLVCTFCVLSASQPLSLPGAISGSAPTLQTACLPIAGGHVLSGHQRSLLGFQKWSIFQAVVAGGPLSRLSCSFFLHLAPQSPPPPPTFSGLAAPQWKLLILRGSWCPALGLGEEVFCRHPGLCLPGPQGSALPPAAPSTAPPQHWFCANVWAAMVLARLEKGIISVSLHSSQPNSQNGKWPRRASQPPASGEEGGRENLAEPEERRGPNLRLHTPHPQTHTPHQPLL